jgi:signal transduction histidine kinase/CheY-like chemotaxis protein
MKNTNLIEKCKRLEQELTLFKDASRQWTAIQKMLQKSNTSLKKTQKELVIAKKNAEASVKAKATFLASMSHEIRTPMNGVLGMTSLLENSELNDEQIDYVRTIKTCSESLLTIINEILDFSKLESGNLELEYKPLSLSILIEDIFALLQEKVNKKNVELLYLIDEDLSDSIYGDVTRLRQIILNLVNNAIKFTKEGEILITVKKTNYKPDGKITIQFSIKDTGLGIPEDKFDRLFKPFSQVDSSTTRKYGGTGLGLIISKKLSEAMGGHIWFESEFKKGTTFFFDIITAVAPPVKKEYPKEDISELKNLNILILDDNLTNLKILNLWCTQWGMNIVEFLSPLDAIEFLNNKNNKIDIIISDYHMPEMDGLQFTETIRKQFSIETLPVILLSSANNIPAEKQELFNNISMKPIRHDKLFRILISSLSKNKTILNRNRDNNINIFETISDTYPIKILVAEDNIINQKLIRKILEKMGYNATIVADGEEVLQILGINKKLVKNQTEHFDLIFMDCQMPVIDGYETTKIIRKKEKIRQPYIVAMTANAMRGDKEKCLNAGMDDYISKPINLNEVKTAIKNALEINKKTKKT